MNKTRVKDLMRFMISRHDIYVSKISGEPKPWTRDPILQQYRFCNVYRELDTVTKWIADNWRKPHDDNRDLWFAMVVARLINLPDSLSELSFPLPWRPDRFLVPMRQRESDGLNVFNAAYIVSTNGRKMDKLSYIVYEVLDPLWKDRASIRPRLNESLSGFCERLTSYQGIGTFMAGQIIADIKYATVLRGAPDWYTFAVDGPGSRRGMNRMLERGIDTPFKKGEWGECHAELHAKIKPLVSAANMPKLHAQDLQNCLCEFDKYERARLGEGRPKQRYEGRTK